MNSRHPIAQGGESHPIVYVRKVAPIDLPEKLRAEAGEAEDVYAVHDAQGERLALVRGRQLAFALARRNDMTPVNVH